ncbi:MAG: MFS transporter [Cyanobacteria bacterium QS_8_64_29]|nr:MAG: MFS transporter [Cyanobacteria bacterium QS_8_64_29]
MGRSPTVQPAANSLRELQPAQLKNLLFLFVAGLSFWIGLTAMLPTLPAYISDVGGSKQQVGLVMGSFAAGLLLFRPWLGRLADRRSRKLAVAIGTAVGGVAPLGYWAVDSIPLLVAIRGFHGISIAAFTTGYSTLVVDWSPPDKKGELIGYMSLVVPIGMAIGTAGGGYLQAQVGYGPLFGLAGAIGLVGFALSSQVADAPSCDRGGAGGSQRFWQLLASPRLRVPTAVLFLMGLVFGAIASFLPLFIRDLGVALNPGLYYTIVALASFIVRTFAGRASDRYGRGAFITGSLLCYATAMVLLAGARTPADFILAALVQGVGAGTLLPMSIALMADRSAANERGRVYSICVGGFDLGIALASPFVGVLAQALGYRGLFALAAGLVAVALLVFVTRANRNLAHSLRFATGRSRDAYALEQTQ